MKRLLSLVTALAIALLGGGMSPALAAGPADECAQLPAVESALPATNLSLPAEPPLLAPGSATERDNAVDAAIPSDLPLALGALAAPLFALFTVVLYAVHHRRA